MAERNGKGDTDFRQLSSDPGFTGMVVGDRTFDLVGVAMPGSVYRHVSEMQMRVAYFRRGELEAYTSRQIAERFVARVTGHIEICTNGCGSTAAQILIDGDPRRGETK